MPTKPKAKTVTPTGMAYESLQLAYDHFNRDLFGGSLPPALITLQRHARSYGYFHGDRFTPAHAEGKHVDEIAMNPLHFAERSVEKTLSTLAHEMAHQWQKHHGKEPSRCYHDKQWAGKMKEIGLHPSDTAEPGGKETGPKVSHYIVADGPFARSCAKFVKSHNATLYQDRLGAQRAATAKAKTKGGEGEGDEDEKPKSKGRAKFVCPGCELNAWAKPSAKLACVPCKKVLVCDEPPEDEAEED